MGNASSCMMWDRTVSVSSQSTNVPPGGLRDMEAWDSELFSLKMYDYIAEERLDEAAHEYMRMTGKEFQDWFFDFMNEDERRAAVFANNRYIFDWSTERCLLRNQEYPTAPAEEVAANKDKLRQILEGRVKWPLPAQGVYQSEADNTLVTVVYCSLNPDELAPWKDYPENCRVAILLDGQLYKGFVSDFNRKIQIQGEDV
mmetsp:Transcript_13692/g.32438  ORF Transcript_13692/g.32438 Transcript_13692/m.32438 type:complete len:200 (-) Transcript_13692:470-1069(-)